FGFGRGSGADAGAGGPPAAGAAPDGAAAANGADAGGAQPEGVDQARWPRPPGRRSSQAPNRSSSHGSWWTSRPPSQKAPCSSRPSTNPASSSTNRNPSGTTISHHIALTPLARRQRQLANQAVRARLGELGGAGALDVLLGAGDLFRQVVDRFLHPVQGGELERVDRVDRRVDVVEGGLQLRHVDC